MPRLSLRPLAALLLATATSLAPAADQHYSPYAPRDDYNDFSRASAREILLRNQANGLDRKTAAALAGGGGIVGDDIGSYILATPLAPVVMMAMLTGKGLDVLGAKWDKARGQRLRGSIGKRIRYKDREDWIEYVDDVRQLEGVKIYEYGVQHSGWRIPFGMDVSPALREALLELNKGNFEGYMRILERGIDIDDFRAAALYQYELSQRPERREEYEAFLTRAYQNAYRIGFDTGMDFFGNLAAYVAMEKGDYSAMSQMMRPRDMDQQVQTMRNTYPGKPLDNRFGEAPLNLAPEDYREHFAVMVVARQLYQLRYHRANNRYGLLDGDDVQETVDTLLALASDDCAARFQYAACGTLWYEALREGGRGDDGKAPPFAVESLLARSPAGDIAALALIASTFEGGRAHTLPAIEAWALREQKPAVLTLIGEGFERVNKFDVAAQWYGKATAAGETLAMRNLAWLQDQGKGLAADPAKATALLEKAVAGGDATARGLLGFRLVTGRGFSADAPRGLALLQEAAPANSEAAYLLGRVHAEGLSVPVDKAQARKWLQPAADRGHPAARKLLATL